MARSDRPDMSYWKRAAQRDGVKCPECHCADLPVYGTKRVGNRVKRYRRCRACGFGPIITYEAVADSSRGRGPK